MQASEKGGLTALVHAPTNPTFLILLMCLFSQEKAFLNIQACNFRALLLSPSSRLLVSVYRLPQGRLPTWDGTRQRSQPPPSHGWRKLRRQHNQR